VLATTSQAESAYIYRDVPVNSSSGIGGWLLTLASETGEPTPVILPTRDHHHDPAPEARAARSAGSQTLRRRRPVV